MPPIPPPQLYPGSYFAGIGQWWIGLSDGDVAQLIRNRIGKGSGDIDEVVRAYRFDVAERAALDQFRRYASGRDPVPEESMYDARERALKWITPGKYPELIPELIPLVSTEKPYLRRQVARHLTAYGDAALIAHLAPRIAATDLEAAYGIIDGYKTARLGGRGGDAAYRTALYPLVETMVVQKFKWMGWDEPPEPSLLHLDGERGRAILRPRFDDLELGLYSNAIVAFVEAPQWIDSAELLRLIEEDRREDLPPQVRGWRFAAALQVLAAQRHPSAPALISEVLAGPFVVPKGAHHTVKTRVIARQSGAADALGIWHSFKLDETWLEVRRHFLPRKYMTTVEADLDTTLKAGIASDGVDQYIDTDMGNFWPLDLGALDRMGATMKAEIFRRLCAVFGPDGPSVDLDERLEQVVALGDTLDDAKRAFDDAWYECPELLEAKRRVYAIDHREELAALPDPRTFSL